MLTDLRSVTESLRAAVDDGDLGKIAEGVAALERLEPGKPSTGLDSDESIDDRAKRLAPENRTRFRRFLVEATGCDSQDGWPCGTCVNAVLHWMGLDAKQPAYHDRNETIDRFNEVWRAILQIREVA